MSGGSTAGDPGRRIAVEVARRVAAVRDDAEDRFRLAKAFYDATTGPEIEGWGRAELAFMRWEIERGALNPPHARVHPGSPWWRAVNERIIRDALEASLVADAGPVEPSSPAVAFWGKFLDAPSSVTWYRAHNASVLAGYTEASHIAARERPTEQFLMNLVLARVLFVQALAEGEPFAAGRLSLFAAFLADPRSSIVPFVLAMARLYPRSYPLAPLEEERLERQVRSSENDGFAIMDDELCENLEELFAFAAKTLDVPDVVRFIHKKLPCYPQGLLSDPHPGGRKQWLPWLDPGLAKDSRWSDELLNRMRLVADPEADEIVASYFDGLETDDPPKLFRNLVGHTQLPPEERSPAVEEYLAARPPLPAWADPDLMRKGEDFFGRWGLYVPLVLICSSLPQCYAAAKGVQVLWLTAELESNTKRRIVETAQMVLDVMAPGGMEPGARGYMTVRHVRLMHAGVRYLILHDQRVRRAADGGEGWRWSDDLGVPINQEDLAGTLTTFSWTVIAGLDFMGVPMTPEEQEAYVHAWNVVGAMLGIREELIPKDVADAEQLADRIQKRQWSASAEGREMTDALLEMLKRSLPGRLLPGFGPTLIRHFIGDNLAEQLGVPKASPVRPLLGVGSKAVGLIGLSQQRSWVARRAAATVSRTLLQSYATFDRGGGRPAFPIPLHLRGAKPASLPRRLAMRVGFP